MTQPRSDAACSPVPLDPLVGRRCGTCKSWHKRDNYACKFNGPYGGGTDDVEGCKWKPEIIMVSKAAQELGRKGGMAKSEAKTVAARANAKMPRRKWITVCHYGVIGADGKMHVGHLIFFSRFSLDLVKNGDRIYDYITEDLQWCKDTALPWKELVHFGGVMQPIP